MAEHANVDVIRWFYAAFEVPDWTPAVRALLRDDVVWHLPGAHPHAGEHIGAEAVLAAMRSFNGYVRLELHDVVGNDEHAVALLKARRRPRKPSLRVAGGGRLPRPRWEDRGVLVLRGGPA